MSGILTNFPNAFVVFALSLFTLIYNHTLWRCFDLTKKSSRTFLSTHRHYRSLSEFFTRSLRNDVRLIAPDVIVSPCDGRVLHLGPVTSDTHLEQVKGVTYSLESFLGPRTKSHDAESFVESLKHKKEGTSLYHCIIYLAPGDYHRFHSPANWKPELRRHFHGELLSVSPKVAKWVPGLFALNERAAYLGSWEHGFFSFTAVGECAWLDAIK